MVIVSRRVGSVPSGVLSGWVPLLVAVWMLCGAACGDDDVPTLVDGGAPVDAGPVDADRIDTGTPDSGPSCEDADGDGVPSAACGGADCDDADPNRFPGATEVCDGDDEDCDDATFGGDADGDGYASSACCNGAGNCGDDCDDALNTVNPRAAETCNAGVDDDCDGLADAADGVCVPCTTGYVGFDGDCRDVDECAAGAPCGVGALAMGGCTNLEGSYRCACSAGYLAPTSGGTCANVDECAASVNPCGVGACTDNAGSYLCTCPMGFRPGSSPSLTCVDVDECATGMNDCDASPLATCRNTEGGFACDCPSGYDGSGRGAAGCTDIDECAAGLDDCDEAPSATCSNQTGAFACACPSGYVGTGRGPSGCLLDDPSLSGLVVGAGAVLSPAFRPGQGAYTLELPFGEAVVSVVPSFSAPERVTVTVDGMPWVPGTPIELALGAAFSSRSVTLRVTTETGASRDYVFELTRHRSVYVKASNTGANDAFGTALALSADGSTLAVGAPNEASAATGVNGNQASEAAPRSGAVYVFRLGVDGVWIQEAYLKASNGSLGYAEFGGSVSLSADGARLAVGAMREASAATGVNGDASNVAADGAGAVYLFQRSASGSWSQEAYVKASNTEAYDEFGTAVALSADGSTLSVGARGERSAAVGLGGDSSNNAADLAGAVYVFRRSSVGAWSQEAYVKASDTAAFDRFGSSLTLSANGGRLVVGAPSKNSSTGAVYVFTRAASGVWSQEATWTAPNADVDDAFGWAVSLSSDGGMLAVGAVNEASSARGIGGDAANNAAQNSGAVYVFRRTAAAAWELDAYVKASNSAAQSCFGWSVALAPEGSTLAVGAIFENSSATGLGGDPFSIAAPQSGAAYVFRRSASGTWSQVSYVKASNTDPYDFFGATVALSSGGAVLAVGAKQEGSAATGMDGDSSNNDLTRAGAVYVY
jgi:hypothetical protein